MAAKKRPVIITVNNAIFFGWTTLTDNALVGTDAITLTGARWVYYWKHPTGMGGLCSEGPKEGSRLSSAHTLTVKGPAQSVHRVSAKAATAWKTY